MQYSLFPTRLKGIEQKANSQHFVWTIAAGDAYASVPKCLPDLRSRACEVVLSFYIPNELRWLAKQIRPFVPGTLPVSYV